MNKKRSSKPKMTLKSKRIDFVFRMVEWLIYVGFTILAGLFMKGVLNQYQSKNTFMAQSFEPITRMPTIVICFNSKHHWKYDEEVTISYRITGYHDKVVLKQHEIVLLQEDGQSVVLEQFTFNCFRLNSSLKSAITTIKNRYIYIEFEKDLKNKLLPPSVHFYFTSKDNSFWAFDKIWKDGKVFHQMVGLGRYAKVELESEEFKYLDIDNQCDKQSQFEKWKSTLANANFTGCPKICTPVAGLDLPFCGWDESNEKSGKCATEVLENNLIEYRDIGGFKRSCDILTYKGTMITEKEYRKRKLRLAFQYSPSTKMTTLHTEHLVFDLIGMIGSVGGTLGMCIGFSFTGLSSNVLNYLKDRIKTIF